MKWLITGGTGLVGRRLIAGLVADGHEVHNLGRGRPASIQEGVHHHQWDGTKVPDTVPVVDVVANLAGASIGKRWSREYKKLLISSRVDATRACVEFLNAKPKEGQVLLSASGFNYYGDLLEAPVTEASTAGSGFMSQICKAWEAAAQGSAARTVTMRIAVVLDKEDGPLAKMLTPYKLFLGGPVGSGRQGFPWIHLDDLVRAIRFLADNASVSGPVNMVAPQAIRQREFAKALGKAMGRPSLFRLPKWVLQLVFGEMSVVLWGGAFVQPGVLKDSGFMWKFPEIDAALLDLMKR